MMKRWGFLAVILLGAGCVSTGRFKAQEAQTEMNRRRAEDVFQQLASTKISLDKAKTTGDELKAELAARDEQLASLKKSNQDLQSSLEAKKGELTDKVSDLIKEKDALSQNLADTKKDLAAAQEDKKALERAKAEEVAKVKSSYEALTAGLKSEIAAGEIQITQLKGKLTVNMVDRILFESGHAEVQENGRKVLDKVAALLAKVIDKDIRIEGHTDSKPIVGELKNKYPTNWELSTARATAVARYLQDEGHLDGAKLVAAGYAEFRPVAANDTPERRALNRRIEIVLVPKE